MSTLSSLVLTSSSTFTLDVIKTFRKEMDEKSQVFGMRVFIVFYIIISAVIAVIKDSFPGITFIAQMMGVSWGALAGSFLAPFLYGLYWKGASKAGCFASFLFGTVVMILNVFLRPSFPALLQSPINCGAFTMIAGFIIVPLVSFITKKPDKAVVEDAFICYDETTIVKQTTSLGE